MYRLTEIKYFFVKFIGNGLKINFSPLLFHGGITYLTLK